MRTMRPEWIAGGILACNLLIALFSNLIRARWRKSPAPWRRLLEFLLFPMAHDQDFVPKYWHRKERVAEDLNEKEEFVESEDRLSYFVIMGIAGFVKIAVNALYICVLRWFSNRQPVFL